MASNWKMGHTESLAADVSTIEWIHTGTGATITETNTQGLVYTYERVVIAADGVHAKTQEAKACYGFAEAYTEECGLDAWLDFVSCGLSISHLSKRGQYDLCASHCDFTCDQMFHAGQYRLGNEGCDGCEPCDWIASLA